MVEIGELVDNRYEVKALAGAGRTSEVYRALDKQTGLEVALKAVRRELLTASDEGMMRFVREGATLKQINHPNIVKVYDTIELPDGSYIVMEFLGGGSIEQKIALTHPMSMRYALDVVLRVSEALTYLHGLNIYHRDVNPNNIMLTERGEPRLMDFSVAKMGHLSPMTLKAQLLGTVAYMSPEVLLGERRPPALADVWALGMTLYKMLAGELPFIFHAARDVMQMTQKPAPPISQYRSDATPELVELLQRMLERDPDKRLNSMQQVSISIKSVRPSSRD